MSAVDIVRPAAELVDEAGFALADQIDGVAQMKTRNRAAGALA
jgi:hypothetical protein